MPERAAQLARAGAALFIERGYREVDIDDIAARCGVSHGTFYSYFSSKRDLLESILSRTEDDMVAMVAAANDWTAVADRSSFIADFRSLIERSIHYFADHAALLSFVILEAPGVDADAYGSLLSGYRRLGTQVAAILQVAGQRGWLGLDGDVDMERVGQMVISCVAAAALPLLLGTGEQVDIEQLCQTCSDYLLGGLHTALPR